jgi:hypothetical protein
VKEESANGPGADPIFVAPTKARALFSKLGSDFLFAGGPSADPDFVTPTEAGTRFLKVDQGARSANGPGADPIFVAPTKARAQFSKLGSDFLFAGWRTATGRGGAATGRDRDVPRLAATATCRGGPPPRRAATGRDRGRDTGCRPALTQQNNNLEQLERLGGQLLPCHRYVCRKAEEQR